MITDGKALILTKLLQPQPAPLAIAREHVVERLNRGLALGRQTILVSAPAGFGKTTCVGTWARTLAYPLAWLSLEPADNEPVRFFNYFIAALQQIDENLGWELEGVLQSGHIPPSGLVSTILINDVLQLDQRFVLIIDDFQVVQERAILDVLETLLDNLPPSLHLVLVTREDPPLPLARIRASSQLTEIRAADLRFTHDEIVQFLVRKMALSLTQRDILKLEAKTEGWPVGLQLAALAMQSDQVNHSDFIDDLGGNHHHILSYLTEEVFNQQPDAVQQFLLQTSILDRLCGGLCDAVTGRTDSQAVLEGLLKANLFLFALDDTQHWYRYHHLFLELLRDLLGKHRSLDGKVLHRRACRWFLAAGLVDEAMHHALAADDRVLVIEIIETHAMELLMAWRIKSLEDWSRTVPVEWCNESLKASLVFAWLYLFRGNTAQALVHIDACQHQIPSSKSPALHAEWLALQSMLLTGQGKAVDSLRLTEEALSMIADDDPYVRSLIHLGQAGAYQQMNDFDSAFAAYHNIIVHGQATASLVSELLGISGLALMAMEQGRLHHALRMATQGADRIEQSGLLLPISTGIYGELGQIYFEWNELEQSHHYFRRAVQMGKVSGFSEAEAYYAVIRSRLAQREANLQVATDEIEEAVRLIQHIGPTDVREDVLSQLVRVSLAQDRLADAQRILEDDGFALVEPIAFPALEVRASVRATRIRAMSVLYNAALRVLLYRARARDDVNLVARGLQIVDQLLHVAIDRHYLPIALEAWLIRARLHHEQGQEDQSIDDLVQAVNLAEPEGFISILVDEGPFVAEALAKLRKHQVSSNSEFIERIQRAFASIGFAEQNKSPIEPLTERERDVLRLLAQGMTYQQVGDHLYISLNTVRFYVKEIYSKLGVNNRTQAIAFAREQSLI